MAYVTYYIYKNQLSGMGRYARLRCVGKCSATIFPTEVCVCVYTCLCINIHIYIYLLGCVAHTLQMIKYI